MSTSDPTMHPRDQFGLRVEGGLLVLQRMEATRPMAAPDQRWVDVTPEMYCTDAELAAQISRRLATSPARALHFDGGKIERRGVLKGMAAGVIGALIGREVWVRRP